MSFGLPIATGTVLVRGWAVAVRNKSDTRFVVDARAAVFVRPIRTGNRGDADRPLVATGVG
jgi:hypothetical protein